MTDLYTGTAFRTYVILAHIGRSSHKVTTSTNTFMKVLYTCTSLRSAILS